MHLLSILLTITFTHPYNLHRHHQHLLPTQLPPTSNSFHTHFWNHGTINFKLKIIQKTKAQMRIERLPCRDDSLSLSNNWLLSTYQSSSIKIKKCCPQLFPYKSVVHFLLFFLSLFGCLFKFNLELVIWFFVVNSRWIVLESWPTGHI